jgi:hypothetical protein
LNDLMRSLEQVRDCEIRRATLALTVWQIDQECTAPSRVTSDDIAPAIANHEAIGQIDLVYLSRLQEHTGLRLTAIAAILVVVEAGEDRRERQLRGYALVNLLNCFTRLGAARDIRLVGDHDQQPVVLLQ